MVTFQVCLHLQKLGYRKDLIGLALHYFGTDDSLLDFEKYNALHKFVHYNEHNASPCFSPRWLPPEIIVAAFRRNSTAIVLVSTFLHSESTSFFTPDMEQHDFKTKCLMCLKLELKYVAPQLALPNDGRFPVVVILRWFYELKTLDNTAFKTFIKTLPEHDRPSNTTRKLVFAFIGQLAVS